MARGVAVAFGAERGDDWFDALTDSHQAALRAKREFEAARQIDEAVSPANRR